MNIIIKRYLLILIWLYVNLNCWWCFGENPPNKGYFRQVQNAELSGASNFENLKLFAYDSTLFLAMSTADRLSFYTKKINDHSSDIELKLVLTWKYFIPKGLSDTEILNDTIVTFNIGNSQIEDNQDDIYLYYTLVKINKSEKSDLEFFPVLFESSTKWEKINENNLKNNIPKYKPSIFVLNLKNGHLLVGYNYIDNKNNKLKLYEVGFVDETLNHGLKIYNEYDISLNSNSVIFGGNIEIYNDKLHYLFVDFKYPGSCFVGIDYKVNEETYTNNPAIETRDISEKIYNFYKESTSLKLAIIDYKSKEINNVLYRKLNIPEKLYPYSSTLFIYNPLFGQYILNNSFIENINFEMVTLDPLGPPRTIEEQHDIDVKIYLKSINQMIDKNFNIFTIDSDYIGNDDNNNFLKLLFNITFIYNKQYYKFNFDFDDYYKSKFYLPRDMYTLSDYSYSINSSAAKRIIKVNTYYNPVPKYFNFIILNNNTDSIVYMLIKAEIEKSKVVGLESKINDFALFYNADINTNEINRSFCNFNPFTQVNGSNEYESNIIEINPGKNVICLGTTDNKSNIVQNLFFSDYPNYESLKDGANLSLTKGITDDDYEINLHDSNYSENTIIANTVELPFKKPVILQEKNNKNSSGTSKIIKSSFEVKLINSVTISTTDGSNLYMTVLDSDNVVHLTKDISKNAKWGVIKTAVGKAIMNKNTGQYLYFSTEHAYGQQPLTLCDSIDSATKWTINDNGLIEIYYPPSAYIPEAITYIEPVLNNENNKYVQVRTDVSERYYWQVGL